ncbi:hypothetical protein [Pseudoalteromonas sp. H105]|uniref:hypothetical protein n=1 Tax=Pseudoalteromonas sp. H105 TaxID=1348393 RepID=UPI0007320BCE|nr:hypothetical protein [Pseudoalteromonas sp. H105]KTF16329.1 hypothetical protein ATS75_08035 [Pseudoalteromonas sp. H105]
MKKPEIRISTGTIKDLAVIALIVIVAWKAISADFSFTFENIKTSDLLAILLALFAIGLSVAFFVKANEVSNMFYDNMYKFTKDNSELLGRMESGFSEQLRHLDQGYTGLRDKFDKLPLDLGKTREKVEDEKAEVLKLKSEKNELLNELANRANLQEEEKQELFSRINDSEIKLIKAQREMRRLQHKLRDADDSEATINGILVRAVKHTQRKVVDLLGIDDFESASDEEICNNWQLIKEELPRVYVKDLRRGGALDGEYLLTEEGVQFIRDVASGNV